MKRLRGYMAAVLAVLLLLGTVAMSGCRDQGNTDTCDHSFVEGVCSQCGKREEKTENEGSSEDESELGKDPTPDIDTDVSEGKETVDKNGIKYVYKGNRTCIVAGVTESFKLTSVEIPAQSPDGDKVVGIGDHAFENCFDLAEITLPSGVTAIGDQAFLNCSALKTVALPDGVEKLGEMAFEGCRKLESVTLSEKLLSIPVGCFRNCVSLSGIELPEKITFVGEEAFYNCTALEEVSLAGVTYIGTSAFERCVELKEIALPASVQLIDAHAFQNCPELCRVVFLSAEEGSEDDPTQTVIGDMAFKNNRKLETVQFSESVAQIGVSAFEGCIALAELTVPTSLTEIGVSAFRNCTALNKLSFREDAELKAIGDSAFAGCTSLETLALPSHLESIESSAFYACSALREVSFPTGEGKLSIGSYAFSACERLERLFFENTETTIGVAAFSGCSGLCAIDLNSDLMHIDDLAFASCEKLEDVYVQGGLVLGSDVFRETPLPIRKYANGSYLGTESNPHMILIGYDAPSSFETIDVIVHEDTTTITGNAFREIAEDSRFTEIMIPKGIGSLGDEVFSGCIYLQKVMFAQDCEIVSIGNRAFYQCEALEEIVLPESLIEIRKEAFDGCSSLSSIAFPASLRTVGEAAFRGCKALKDISFAETVSLTVLEPSVFESCTSLESVSIPISVEVVGSNAFKGCTALKNVDLDGQTAMRQIESTAFEGCAQLTYMQYGNGLYLGNINKPYLIFMSVDDRTKDTVTLHEDAILIVDEAMKNYSALTTLDCSSNSALKRIGDSALYGCGNLSKLYIPASVTDIGADALRGCGALTSIQVSAANQRYVSDDNCLIEAETKTLLRGCSQSRIPEDGSVEVIGAYAFDACTELYALELPSSIRQIGQYAFSQSGLKHIQYCGDPELWKSMDRDENWATDAHALTQILCGEETWDPAEMD